MKNELRLPAEVVARLAEQHVDVPSARQRNELVELRRVKVELRTDDNGDPIVEGYATVYDHPYDVAGGPPYGWTEIISKGAAAKSIVERDDVRFLVNHEGVPLARTKSGTLKLTSDDIGLKVETTGLDMRNPLAVELVSAMERGDIDEMSFAFRVTRGEWNEDFTERTITEVKLYDVSVVTYPANPATVAQVRQNADQPEPRAGLATSLARATADSLRLRH